MGEQTPSSRESKENPIDTLARLTGGDWKHLRSAREYSPLRRNELQTALSGLEPTDTSVVVFGSLARDEATIRSDTDWTLVVDGIAVPEHLDAALEIQRRLADITKGPGIEGTFGDLVFSHQILHWIGGEDDSNANTTRRMLLLLESKPLGNPDAWNRVINNVLSRYIREDRGLWNTERSRRVPHFLLNDISRYWRIVVVDLAYKQRTRANKGYALRSIKLDFSRKLTFVSGLLACYSCHLDIDPIEWQAMSEGQNPQSLIEHLRANFAMTPLEALAYRLVRYETVFPVAKRLFDSYDKFLALMADEQPGRSGQTPREHLDKLAVENLETDDVFQYARQVRQEFGTALRELFLRPGTELYDLTIEFGVF
jgi:predicted nucleotidyltransferase